MSQSSPPEDAQQESSVKLIANRFTLHFPRTRRRVDSPPAFAEKVTCLARNIIWVKVERSLLLDRHLLEDHRCPWA
jgi:hypothetical protein